MVAADAAGGLDVLSCRLGLPLHDHQPEAQDIQADRDYIASALRTEGSHLLIGRGGFTLYYTRGARLSGYDCESIKACCVAAGVPVIDSRMVAFGAAHRRHPASYVGRWRRLPLGHAASRGCELTSFGQALP